MSTVGALIDRLYRDLLLPADDSPVTTTLAAEVNAVTGTWTYVGTDLSADEEELFAVGVVVEVEQEQAVITAVDHATNTLTVRRGANGTTAAVHTIGKVITPAPTFSRRSSFDAVADNVVALYPTLYRQTTSTLVTTANYTEVSADATVPVSAVYVSNGRPREIGVQWVQDFPGSSTGKAIITNGVGTGSTVYFTWRGRFTRPTQESDDLQTLGVDEGWERIVMVGAAAQLLSGREFDSVNSEFITEQMRSEGYPAGTSSRLRNELLRYHAFLLEQHRRVLLATYPEVITTNAVS